MSQFLPGMLVILLIAVLIVAPAVSQHRYDTHRVARDEGERGLDV